MLQTDNAVPGAVVASAQIQANPVARAKAFSVFVSGWSINLCVAVPQLSLYSSVIRPCILWSCCKTVLRHK
jgi:hypothetical protein